MADDAIKVEKGKWLQHFVPRSYLRGFAADDGRLLGILRKPYEARSLHVDHVAAEGGFYKVRRSDGTLSDDVENKLAEFDGRIPQIVGHATSADDISPGQIAGLRMLYANLAARSHRGRDLLLAEVQRARKRVEREYERDFPGDSPQQRDRIVDSVIRQVFNHPEGYAADPETVSRVAIPRLARDVFATLPLHACVLASEALDSLRRTLRLLRLIPRNHPTVQVRTARSSRRLESNSRFQSVAAMPSSSQTYRCRLERA
jgi:hypothetical protein